MEQLGLFLEILNLGVLCRIWFMLGDHAVRLKILWAKAFPGHNKQTETVNGEAF